MKPRVLVIGQVEDETHIIQEIAKQTVQPDEVHIMVDFDPAKTINSRRKRIAYNHNFLKDAARKYKVDLIWQVEGDAVLPPDCLERLLQDYEVLKGEDFAYVSGIQVGRHGLYCLGAWVDMTDTGFQSLDFNKVGSQEVDATGFYCLLADKDTWLTGRASWTDEPYGPDVVWGLSIEGKKYCDMDLHIGHKVKNGIIKPTDASTCIARFFKNEKGEWKYKQI